MAKKDKMSTLDWILIAFLGVGALVHLLEGIGWDLFNALGIGLTPEYWIKTIVGGVGLIGTLKVIFWRGK